MLAGSKVGPWARKPPRMSSRWRTRISERGHSCHSPKNAAAGWSSERMSPRAIARPTATAVTGLASERATTGSSARWPPKYSAYSTLPSCHTTSALELVRAA